MLFVAFARSPRVWMRALFFFGMPLMIVFPSSPSPLHQTNADKITRMAPSRTDRTIIMKIVVEEEVVVEEVGIETSFRIRTSTLVGAVEMMVVATVVDVVVGVVEADEEGHVVVVGVVVVVVVEEEEVVVEGVVVVVGRKEKRRKIDFHVYLNDATELTVSLLKSHGLAAVPLHQHQHQQHCHHHRHRHPHPHHQQQSAHQHQLWGQTYILQH
jgi:hypothetical protein